ncbi:MAG TPA: VOC family protein [Candidatus Saccharimonadales bacterium]|nr:VOC family protein [Candidatus Saccharimonadales bacterium]
MPIRKISDGHCTVTPYLIVGGVARLLEFLGRAFEAREVLRLPRPDGSIMHAEVTIGGARVMMGEPTAEFGPMPASVYLGVPDCDSAFRRAVEAGGTPVMEPADQPHAGQRYGGVKDPSGNIWWVATHIEDLSVEEQVRRAKARR